MKKLYDVNLENFKNKIVKVIEPNLDWRDNLIGITIYFTDGTSLDISSSGENSEITIY